ncbi:hypothetical protein [Amycolatopsis plumensis]|uniref:Uncharacterized protein n=1 Tax=Amycolatopsis plumensis TaxID=236508 RepID=A0ABV5UFA1_9PSEU
MPNWSSRRAWTWAWVVIRSGIGSLRWLPPSRCSAAVRQLWNCSQDAHTPTTGPASTPVV